MGIAAKILERCRIWLDNNHHFWFSWYTKDSQETQESEGVIIELPATMQQKLVNAVENLPSNPRDKQAIASTIDEAFDRWRNNPSNANNSVLILSSPITNVSRILSETLEEWGKEKQASIKILPLRARPTAIETIKSQLEHHLTFESKKYNSQEQKPEVLVIPNLSWCFLRSLEGLEGIEYLQSLWCEDANNRFWIIGTDPICLDYLDLVCNLQAYCGEVVTLPAIASEELQEWFDSIIDEFKITFHKPDIDQQLLDRDKDNKTHYFDRLSSISKGVSIVAVQVFLRSIQYQEADSNEEDETQPKAKILVAQTPKLPNLPALEPEEQYVLYSILLHGDITIFALAESLGDDQWEVQARVQILRRKGLVEEQDGVLKINPVHYPKLKQNLKSNNFIIDQQ